MTVKKQNIFDNVYTIFIPVFMEISQVFQGIQM